MSKQGPDSFNSWIIASACCFINMMMYGMARLSGVLFVASVPRFQVSRERASFPYTLSQATRNMSGPLVGYLGQHLGVRLVSSVGCVIGAAGIAVCFLAEDIAVITVFWGIVFGLGFGLGNILLPVSINQYFDKKRATASGISFSGACIGSFAIPPVVELLIEEYGLSGSFLILSGFVLNCLPAALLLRKRDFSIRQHRRQPSGERRSITDGKKVKMYSVETTMPTSRQLQSSKDPYLGDPKLFLSPSRISGENPKHRISNGTLRRGDLGGMRSEHQHKKQSVWEPRYGIARAKSTESVRSSCKEDSDSTYSKSYDGGFAYQTDIERFKGRPKVSSSDLSVRKASSLESFDIIFDPVFILIALTNAVYSAMFVCMMTVIVDFAKDINVEETYQKYILMSLSVGDLAGRLCLGWVTDDGHMTRSNFAAICFFFQGVTTTVIAFSTGFTMLMVMAALYGLSEAGLILIFPLLVAEFIEEKKQTVAIPCSYFLSGPLCLTVAPLIGFFRDEIGSYDFIFYGMGLISFVCTLSWLLAPCIVRCRRKK